MPETPTANVASAAGIKLRNMQATVITGADAAALTTALNAFFDDAGEKVLVLMARVADHEVLLVYAE